MDLRLIEDERTSDEPQQLHLKRKMTQQQVSGDTRKDDPAVVVTPELKTTSGPKCEDCGK